MLPAVGAPHDRRFELVELARYFLGPIFGLDRIEVASVQLDLLAPGTHDGQVLDRRVPCVLVLVAKAPVPARDHRPLVLAGLDSHDADFGIERAAHVALGLGIAELGDDVLLVDLQRHLLEPLEHLERELVRAVAVGALDLRLGQGGFRGRHENHRGQHDARGHSPPPGSTRAHDISPVRARGATVWGAPGE